MVVRQAEMRVRKDEDKELKRMKEIYRLIYCKEMLCYSYELVPQTKSSSIILGSNGVSSQDLWPATPLVGEEGGLGVAADRKMGKFACHRT